MDYTTSQQNFFDDRYISTCGSGRNRRDCKGRDNEQNRTLVGLVGKVEQNGDGKEVNRYSTWLRENYKLEIPIEVDPKRIRADGTPKAWDER